MSKYAVQQGILFEDFETVGDWSAGSEGTVTADTTKFKTGTKSLKLVTDGAGVSSSFQVTKTISADLSRAGTMVLWVYIEDDTNTSTFTIRFSSTTDFSKYFTYAHASAVHEGWNKVIIGKDQWTNQSSEDWANTMIRMRLIVAGASIGVVGTVYFDSLYINAYSRPKCVLIFDDFSNTVYSVAYPYMRSKGVKGVLAGVSSYAGLAGKMTLAQIQEMHQAGWDVVNHTSDHTNLTTLSTQAEMEEKISVCRDWMVTNGFTRNQEDRMFVYPQSGQNQTAWAALRNLGFLAARGNFNRVQGDDVDELYALAGNSNDSGTTLADIIAKIDRAISGGGAALLYFHIFVSPETISTHLDPAIFYGVIDYLVKRRNEIDVMTMTEWYKGLTVARKPA